MRCEDSGLRNEICPYGVFHRSFVNISWISQKGTKSVDPSMVSCGSICGSTREIFCGISGRYGTDSPRGKTFDIVMVFTRSMNVSLILS